MLGGGQLGRMLLQSAIPLDLYIKVLDPDPDAPCRHIAAEFVCGSLYDFDTVVAFGKDCDVLTIEIEHVDIEALKVLEERGVRVFPQPHLLQMIQDKHLQKVFYKLHNIPTSDFVWAANLEEARQLAGTYPIVQKLCKGGYDGKGVHIVRSERDWLIAFDAPSILEQYIPFDKELAVIVARNELGSTASFPVVEMAFHPTANLVEYLFSPAIVSEQVAHQARALAERVAQELGVVGLLAVEMFLTMEGTLLVNEIAPRPHNSGHHTAYANDTSQFEQHLRAILNLPLGDTTAHTQAAMVNLLGEPAHQGLVVYEGMEQVLGMAGVHPYLYGKKTTKPFRKMGHVTILEKDFDKMVEKIKHIQKTIKIRT